jgi:hypothetical protein
VEDVSDTDPTPTQDVDFGALSAELEHAEYPMMRKELVYEYGDYELGVGDRTATVREVLGPLGTTVYDSAEDVERSVRRAAGDGVGRGR